MREPRNPPKEEALQEIFRCTREGQLDLAFEKLVRTFQDDVHGYCCNRLPEQDLAKDVAQEIFVAAWKSLPKAKFEYEGKSIAAWVYAIAKNKVLDARIKRFKNKEDPGLEEEESPGTDPREPMILYLDLERAWMKLDPKERDVLLWRAQRFSAREIAELLEEDITEEGVRTRILRARIKLRKLLDEG